MKHPQPVKDYFQSRKPVLTYLGGLGMGIFLGREYLWIALPIAVVILWTCRKPKKE